MKQQAPLDPRRPGLPLGLLIKEKRKAVGLEQDELAHELGLSLSYVWRLEQGEFRRPRPEVLLALAERFNIDVNDLNALTGCLLPTSSPGYAAYLRAKHPDWPPAVVDELVDYYEFIKQRHKLQ